MACCYCDTTTKEIVNITSGPMPPGHGYAEITITDDHDAIHYRNRWILNATEDGIEFSLLAVKIERIEDLRAEVMETVLERYPTHNQTTYALMHSHAIRNGQYPIRANYIEQGVGWADAVFGFFYDERDNILGLATLEEVEDYDWSAGLTALLAADPQISVEGARAIFY